MPIVYMFKIIQKILAVVLQEEYPFLLGLLVYSTCNFSCLDKFLFFLLVVKITIPTTAKAIPITPIAVIFVNTKSSPTTINAIGYIFLQYFLF